MTIERQNKRNRLNVFGDEIEILKASKEFISNGNFTSEECVQELITLQKSYDELLDQAKLITKVSDRLQNKINKANEELEFKNVALQESLDALTKAKLSRKANTITLICVFILFIITEAFVEPKIDAYANENFKNFTPIALALVAKGIIALTLRPIEKIVEKRLYKQETERIQANKEKERIENEQLVSI